MYQQQQDANSQVMQQILQKVGKLDVVEQRVADIADDIREVKSSVTNMLPRMEYERKNITGKLAAVQKELSDFKLSVNDRIEAKIKEALDARDSTNDRWYQRINARTALVFGAALAVLTTLLSFTLNHFFK